MEDMYYADIHSHFLFGVDDGAPDMPQTLAMLEQAVKNNFKYLLATPHASDLMNKALSIRFTENFTQVKQLIARHNLPLNISLASELFFSPAMHRWLEYPWATFNHKRKYLLFELPFYEQPEGVGDFIFKSHLKGIYPILAHPERYAYLRNTPQILRNWHQQGCLLQLNAGSLTGQFGPKIETFARKLLKARLIHFVASDAHSAGHRFGGGRLALFAGQ